MKYQSYQKSSKMDAFEKKIYIYIYANVTALTVTKYIPCQYFNVTIRNCYNGQLKP